MSSWGSWISAAASERFITQTEKCKNRKEIGGGKEGLNLFKHRIGQRLVDLFNPMLPVKKNNEVIDDC